jgi:hypothetical protein
MTKKTKTPAPFPFLGQGDAELRVVRDVALVREARSTQRAQGAAARAETEKLNADIERWLLQLHRKHAILFAARREDGEAGGTKLGAGTKRVPRAVRKLGERE